MIAIGIMVGVFLVLSFIKQIIKNRFVRLIRESKTDLDDLTLPFIQGTRWFTFLGLGIYLGCLFLTLPTEIQMWINRGFRILLTIQVGFWGMGLISFYIERQVDAKLEEDQGADATTLDALGLLGKIALWVILTLVILDNLDVEISSLVASLGIGGIAVALAVQNILGDLFSSLTITLDKPFVIGDFIVIDDFEGDVEDIGLKSTRIRSLSGEELIFSNTDLLNSRIRNYKHLEKRRISFSFGITYGTPVEKIKTIPEIVMEIITPMELIEFERVHFRELGDSSLNFNVVYYVLHHEYSTALDIQQEINLALYERFNKEGIEFAFPTQTVIVDK
jgi:small-conductance mechanosensitive channel